MKISLYFFVFFWFSIPVALTQNLENIKDQNPVEFTGAINSHFGLYHANGISPRNSASYWNLNANANLSLWNTIDLPFSFTVGRSGSRVNYPTFAQFGISPTYKSLTAHLGYRNLNFSNYTLAGHTFLGAALELNKPGQIRLTVMRGRLRNVAEVDTTRSFVEPAFKRTGFGFKIGTGTERTFFDLIYFKGKDDASSLESLNETNIKAAENVVLGIKSKVSISQKFWFDLDIAGSAFTRNQNSEFVASDDQVNDYLFLIPKGIFEAKLSSRLNTAGKIGLTYADKHAKIGLNYERIDPDYETMGAYFFANDIERITISPYFDLFKNKVSVSGRYGLQRNNLLKNRLETTSRNIGSGVIDIHPNANFGLNLNFSNYSIYQESGTVALDDTLAFNLSTTNISAMPRLTITGKNTIQNWSFLGNYQMSSQDNQAFFENSQKFSSTLLSLNHNLVFISSQFSINSGLNYNKFSVANAETILVGGKLGMGASFNNKKMMLNFSGSYNKRLLNEADNGHTIGTYFNYSFLPSSAHRFSLNFGLLKSIGAVSSEFSEIRASLGYTYILQKKKKDD